MYIGICEMSRFTTKKLLREYMSRSYRKPYYGNAAFAKWWKRMFNQRVRRFIDLIDGAYYKRINERWCSPMEDAGGYWDVPKLRRK